MKNVTLAVGLAVALVCGGIPVKAQEKPDTRKEYLDLVRSISAKLKDNKRSEQDMADELKKFDALLEQHKDDHSSEAAQILLMKAMLYLQVFKQSDKGLAMMQQLKQNYPGTMEAKKMDEFIPKVEKQIEIEKAASKLKEGVAFPDFEEKGLDGKVLSVSGLKGKVVLVHFWAASNEACVAELPGLLDAYKKYHKQGFEILGISLDRDKTAFSAFLKEREVPWGQYFDGMGVENKLAVRYSVLRTPTTYLLDREGKIVAKNVSSKDLPEQLAKLLKN